MVTLFEICLHWGGCEMESKCAGDIKHSWAQDILEVEVTIELGIEDCTDVGEVCTEVMGNTYVLMTVLVMMTALTLLMCSLVCALKFLGPVII